MKRSALIMGLLLCVAFQSAMGAGGPKRYPHKETTADMSGAKSIFIGWVDLPVAEWSLWGYAGRDDWAQVINDLNLNFKNSCQSKYLAGRTVTGAKDRNDDNAAGNDLYIKFSDVSIDHDLYGIRLSIHFIDPKTNTEVGSIPTRVYYQKRWFRFQLYMQASLEEIGQKIQAEVTGAAPKK